MKTELFNKLVGAVDEAVAHHRGAKLSLRTTTLPDLPEPVTSKTVERVRTAANVSQAVWWNAACCRPALLLFRIAKQHPGVIFPAGAGASAAAGGTRARGRRKAARASPGAKGSKRR